MRNGGRVKIIERSAFAQHVMTRKTSQDPAVQISKIESVATRHFTPCGRGVMVWRAWGEGRPLVLLHGAPGSWTHWILNVPALAARLRVWAPDMPGFGDSDLPPEPHTAASLAGVVAAGLEGLVPAPRTLDVAGFSFGGIVAGLVAARLGRRVRTLVLIGPGGLALPYAAPPSLLSVRSEMTADEVRRAHRENLRRLMLADPERADDLAVLVQTENVRRARFKSGTIPTSDILGQALPAIQTRIVGIWGERDVFVGPYLEERRRLLASVQPDVDFRIVARAGHWVTYEAADDVNAALGDLLGGS